jgi:hypothetical protein
MNYYINNKLKLTKTNLIDIKDNDIPKLDIITNNCWISLQSIQHGCYFNF